jgi:hypothetical protein
MFGMWNARSDQTTIATKMMSRASRKQPHWCKRQPAAICVGLRSTKNFHSWASGMSATQPPLAFTLTC